METKHTPGPWHAQPVSEKSWNVGVYDSQGNEVALVKVKSALHGQRRDADANLIAAAPELLAACEAGFNALYDECLSHASSMQGEKTYVTPSAGVLAKMKAAIKKARGE